DLPGLVQPGSCLRSHRAQFGCAHGVAACVAAAARRCAGKGRHATAWQLSASSHWHMKQTFYFHDVAVTYTDEGQGAPFVLVHGAGANRNYWKSLAVELTNNLGAARIVAPDLFGHGETP